VVPPLYLGTKAANKTTGITREGAVSRMIQEPEDLPD